MKLIKLLAILRLLILITALAGGVVNSSVAGTARQSNGASVSKTQASDKDDEDGDDDEEDEDDDEEDDDDN